MLHASSGGGAGKEQWADHERQERPSGTVWGRTEGTEAAAARAATILAYTTDVLQEARCAAGYSRHPQTIGQQLTPV